MNARRGLKSWLVTTMSENAAVDRLNALVSKLVAAIRPPPNVSVSEWATQNRVLSPEASAEQGRWRNSRTPYLVEIMDAFSDPRIHHIVVVASSQVGKSEFENNVIGRTIDVDPGSILFIHPPNDGCQGVQQAPYCPHDTRLPYTAGQGRGEKEPGQRQHDFAEKLSRRHPDHVRIYRGARSGIKAHPLCAG